MRRRQCHDRAGARRRARPSTAADVARRPTVGAAPASSLGPPPRVTAHRISTSTTAAASRPSPTSAGHRRRARRLGAGAAGAAAAPRARGTKSNSWTSVSAMNRTGVAHSIVPCSTKIALRASDTAASTGARPPIRLVYSSSANRIAAASLIANCMAITAGTPSWTSVVAIAGERVGEAGAGAVARVEHDEAQRRLVGQQARQLAAVELGVAGPVVVLEVQHPVAARREVAVPDVVQHVVRPVAQHLAQPPRRRRRQPVDDDRAGRHHAGDGPLDARPLAGDVERRGVGRVGDHAEDAHRPLDRRRVRQPADVEVAHDRRLALVGEERRRAVQQLPRHAEEGRRRTQRQGQAEPAALRRGGGAGRVVAGAQGTGEQGRRERPTERLGIDRRRRRHRRRRVPSAPPARPPRRPPPPARRRSAAGGTCRAARCRPAPDRSRRSHRRSAASA